MPDSTTTSKTVTGIFLHAPLLSPPELSTILAALRLYTMREIIDVGRITGEQLMELREIATSNGTLPLMPPTAVDELGERLARCLRGGDDKKAPEADVPRESPRVILSVPLTPEFVGDVLCTMIESGYSWFEWRDEECETIQPENEPDNDTSTAAVDYGWRYAAATAVEIDEEDQTEAGEGQRRKIDGDVIAEAIGKILAQSLVNSTIRDYVIHAIIDMDAALIDADTADCIAQVAVFGELRYG